RSLGTMTLLMCLVAGCGHAADTEHEPACCATTFVQSMPETASAGPTRLVPGDAAGFVHIRCTDLWKSEAIAELRQLVGQSGPDAREVFEQKYVPAPSTIDSLTVIFLTHASASAS